MPESPAPPTPSELARPEDTGDTGWQPLPVQARRLFMQLGALMALPAGILARLLDVGLRLPGYWGWMVGFAVAGGVLGTVWGHRRYLHTRWRLDPDGFSLRKGRLWQSEIRVPINRVQHLDVRRGPLERHYRLATLVIHTAGSRDSAVNVGGLSDDDAERLRDRLARQVEHDAA